MRQKGKGRSIPKTPKNCEWRGGTLHGRIRIAGKLRRWTLRTSDVGVARARVAEDIERLKAESYFGDSRAKWSDVAASWAERHILHSVGPKTALRYETSLRQLQPFFEPLYMDEITTVKVGEFVTARIAQGVSIATIRRDLTAGASVHDFAEIAENPFRNRARRLKERREPIVLPEAAHVDQVIARAPPSMKSIIEAARWTGCRLDELVSAKRSAFDRARRTLTVTGKGNKTRAVALCPSAYEVLCAIVPRLGCDVLFWHGECKMLRNLSSRFAAVVRSLDGREDFRRFRFHDLRHLYAVEALKSGMSIYDVQQQLGHASIKVTEWYLKFLTAEEKRAAMYGGTESQNESQGGSRK